MYQHVAETCAIKCFKPRAYRGSTCVPAVNGFKASRQIGMIIRVHDSDNMGDVAV